MSRSSSRVIVCTVLCLAVLALPALAFRDPEEAGFPPDFDLRVRDAGSPGGRAAFVDAVHARFGSDVAVRFGDRSDRPQWVFRPGGVLATVAPGDRVAAARRFLRNQAAVFGLSAAEVDALEPAAVFETADTGVTHVRFLQRYDGISVFRGQVRVNLDARGGVLNVGGEYFPGLSVEAPPTVTPEAALRVAARGIGLAGEVPDALEREEEGEQRTVYAAGGEYLESPAARLMLLPEGAGRSRLVWEVIVWENVTGWDNEYRVLVDARTGEAVLRERMTLYADPAGAFGLVFDETPIHGPQVSRSFAGDPVASPAYWVDGSQTETRGNNVVARADFTGTNNDLNNPLADGGRRLEFDFPFLNSYEQGGTVFDDTDPAITNAFYLGNLIHDYWHALGFDETAGNFQDDNFGRGGLGGDHVDVDVQDGASFTFLRNNANWSPTNDGSPPRTNYYIWTDPPFARRDGAFDATVIWHEFGHGLSTRLVGGATTQCLSGAQGGGMGEGWSDWVAVHYFSTESDDPAGPVVVGEYVTGLPDRGIRRYPYAYDMGLSPLTYADLCDGGSCAVHDEGEIWAVTLWDVRHDLIQQHGYAEGYSRAEHIVIDAMKLSPCSPNMVIMRDAVMQASEQRYAGEDECLLRSAFARRGFGPAAFSNGTGDDAGADFSTVLPMDGSMRFTDAITMAWDAREGAVAYRVARGNFVAADPGSRTFDDASCAGESLVPEFTDASVPSAGTGFYYLLAVEDGCFRSDYGTGTAGSARVVADCP